MALEQNGAWTKILPVELCPMESAQTGEGKRAEYHSAEPDYE